MAEKKHPLGFVFTEGILTGPLKIGMSIEGALEKDFEMREVTLDDLLDAEMEVGLDKPLNFNAQLVARQLIRVGKFRGPFTVGMLRQRLKPIDWRVMRSAQSELEALGEAGSASAEAS